ncbi:uncharacterized protein LOC113232036 [Hyposmocoma kahamanoa]|uniref:uncharacterized protein LOC113232036 n=1 Tax=Hyposmocoma kahamanoa TaxID=1477025 RepID=UPI000E6D6D54|nr:uncharacterized protein LOC113232036 [Hyposmocoma kahamanoa]
MTYNLIGAKAAPVSDNNISDSGRDHVESLDRKVFKLPSKLKDFEEIHIVGTFKGSTERLTVNLVTANKKSASPDFNNIACQIRLDFRNASVTINTVIGGEYRPPKDEETDPDELFSELDFEITFKTKSDKRIKLELQSSSTLHSCVLEHRMEDIEYLTIGGDFDEVKSLNFILAS